MNDSDMNIMDFVIDAFIHGINLSEELNQIRNQILLENQ